MEERDLAMKARLKEMKQQCECLFEDFNYKATIAYNKGEMKEYWYWIGRASDMTDLFSKLVDDLDRLEEWSYEK